VTLITAPAAATTSGLDTFIGFLRTIVVNRDVTG
jgi:hypothetical protein